jgi:hypothetical protein
MMRRLLCLTMALAAPAAWAQSSPWYVGGSVGVTHDSNLLRLGKPDPVPAGLSQSDTTTSVALIGGLDQPIGRQRLSGSFSLRDNRFDRNEKYNNQSYNLGGSLQWSSVYRLSGSLSAGVSRNLSTFNSDVQGVLDDRNYETTKAANAWRPASARGAWPTRWTRPSPARATTGRTTARWAWPGAPATCWA